LAAGPAAALDVETVVADLRADITRVTEGLTASVGVASSKLMAKIASEINKPNGVCIVAPGTELDVLGPMQVTAIPGVGPATAERLRRAGVHTVDDSRRLGDVDLVRILGQASGQSLFRMARADDDRPVVADRETKSISIEDTFEVDVVDRERLGRTIDRMSRSVAEKLSSGGLSARTVTLKVRHHDFESHTRSSTLPGPTDSPRVVGQTAQRLLTSIDLRGGLRLIGVGVSGLADWVQDDLFEGSEELDVGPEPEAEADAALEPVTYRAGMDVHHEQHGDGWVWGAGLGRVTVRFETRHTPPGPVHTFATEDAELRPGHTYTVEP
ncbi:MAG: DNA polymerase IV, partial [Aeromicrobium sp.]